MTVMDNLAGEQKAMKAEHGLSFYVETDHVRILFDFGAGGHTLDNAGRLGIRLDQVDFAVGSHGHYDHAAGYRDFVEAGLGCPLVTGRGFFQEKYALSGPKATYLGTGFDEGFLEQYKIPYEICGSVKSLAEGCWVMGGIQRTHDFETIPERFVIRRENGWEQDYFQDEICLVLEDKGELTVVVGCSHPGILNILDTVRERFPQPIRAVVGGTHLVEADRERIGMTIDVMTEMGIGLLGFNHCSGQLLREVMAQKPGLNTVYLGAGDCLFL